MPCRKDQAATWLSRVAVWKKPPRSLAETKDLQAQKTPLSYYPLGRAFFGGFAQLLNPNGCVGSNTYCRLARGCTFGRGNRINEQRRLVGSEALSKGPCISSGRHLVREVPGR